VQIVAVPTFASGFTTSTPCWPRRSCQDSLGWHRVALVMVVGLVAGVVVLPGVRTVVIAGIRAVALHPCHWHSRRHHPWRSCRRRRWRSPRHRRCRSRCHFCCRYPPLWGLRLLVQLVSWVEGGKMGENGPRQISWPVFVTHYVGLPVPGSPLAVLVPPPSPRFPPFSSVLSSPRYFPSFFPPLSSSIRPSSSSSTLRPSSSSIPFTGLQLPGSYRILLPPQFLRRASMNPPTSLWQGKGGSLCLLERRWLGPHPSTEGRGS
jgi:hypothetical protein